MNNQIIDLPNDIKITPPEFFEFRTFEGRRIVVRISEIKLLSEIGIDKTYSETEHSFTIEMMDGNVAVLPVKYNLVDQIELFNKKALSCVIAVKER